ncbi:MAG: hypothetical protein JO235_26695 [Chroococcidiopsidaceae cyanobacterium CP_BM_RX_35]|nr:hypothetical protein [Chroococcidiopsidaceae cyanobacterium CP_BM_RX_35]
MPKRTSLTAALQEASGKTLSQEPDNTVAQAASVIISSNVPPSRQGKKAVTGHFDPEVSRQLKQLALDNGTTVQALLAESLNDLFIKYKRNPIA